MFGSYDSSTVPATRPLSCTAGPAAFVESSLSIDRACLAFAPDVKTRI